MCKKNVKARCILDCRYPLRKKNGKEVKHGDVVKKIMSAWNIIVESPTQELYANALVEFQDVCSDFPIFLTYAMTTLDEVKEKIVRAWTYHVLHFGCRTTNRVESDHALVKKYLDNSVGDLGACWKKIHDILVIQLTAIQTPFGQSVTVLEHRFKDVTLYSRLGGYVSRYALDNIALEEEHCVWTRKFVVVFKGHRTGHHVHALLLLKSVKISLFYWIRYIIIGICYVWAKKVMKMVFLSRMSGMVFKNVSRKSLTK